MAARASSRAGGFAGSARHDAEIAAAAVGMSVEEWLAAAARPATPPPAHGDSESVARILSSLDRLGARIRTLTPAAEPAPAAPAARPVSTADSLQRAIDQIARKRDALERSSARRPEPAREAAAPVREPAAEIAEIGARVMALTQTPRGPAARAAAPADGLRQDVAELKDMLAELVAASPAETLESSFRGLVALLKMLALRAVEYVARSFESLPHCVSGCFGQSGTILLVALPPLKQSIYLARGVLPANR